MIRLRKQEEAAAGPQPCRAEQSGAQARLDGKMRPKRNGQVIDPFLCWISDFFYGYLPVYKPRQAESARARPPWLCRGISE